MGGVLGERRRGSVEVWGWERIWEVILERMVEIGEIMCGDGSEVVCGVIDGNGKLGKVYEMYKLVG